MTQQQNGINHLYAQLRNVGINPDFARKALPSWWDDEIADAPSGLQQARLFISRSFNIDLSSLVEEKPVFRNVERRFKLQKNQSEVDVSVGAHYATAVAKLALQHFSFPQVPVPPDPLAIRNIIISRHGIVNLETLIEYCASMGVPVLHISTVPGKKMTGLAVKVGGAHAIVLSQSKHSAYLLFHLAHELGHVALNHLQDDGFWADGAIDDEDSGLEEKEADKFATILLNGQDIRYGTSGAIYSADHLCAAAQVTGEKLSVDPGHIILNYSNACAKAGKKVYGMAQLALKKLPQIQPALQTINDSLLRNIDKASISDDQLEFISQAIR